MPAAHPLLLAALFLIAALLYSSVGHAGASGYLAAMALMGVEPSVMKPTSLSLNVLVSIIATIQFARAGHFRWRLFWPFALTSIPAAFIGGRITLGAVYFKPLVGAVLLASAARLIFAAPRASEGEPHPPPLSIALGVGAVLGLLSGLTGTGGGIFLSPILLLCGWADPKKTGAVSALFILVNSLSGLVGLISARGFDLPIRTEWIAAVVGGGMIGSYLGATRFDSTLLRRLLSLVLLVAGSKLVFAW